MADMRKRKKIGLVVIVSLCLLAGLTAWLKLTSSHHRSTDRNRDRDRAIPVQVAAVRQGNMDITLAALGSVVAWNTTSVKSRVEGQLTHIYFQEGQWVKAAHVLAEIDPRPFQMQLDQTSGQLLRDQALLSNAQLDLKRYKDLLAKEAIASQQVDAQAALVRQYQGTVKSDQAQVDNARLQLSFTRITAPISGRLGLRQVDIGNVIRSNDTNALVVITQTQPIAAIFSIPADAISSVLAHTQKGAPLTVEAFDREGNVKLALGTLLSVDNQMDATTGTVKLKAEFANTDNRLFPNQFVNIRLKLETQHNALLMPLSAVQRGARGTFVYVVNADQSVSVRPVTLGASTLDTITVQSGLVAGARVVIDGTDKLREGAKVTVK